MKVGQKGWGEKRAQTVAEGMHKYTVLMIQGHFWQKRMDLMLAKVSDVG